MKKTIKTLFLTGVACIALCACGSYGGDNEYDKFMSWQREQEYLVYFTIGNKTLQKISVKYGDYAVYTGETPSKPSEGGKIYIFSGWDVDPATHPITKETTFRAEFEIKYDYGSEELNCGFITREVGNDAWVYAATNSEVIDGEYIMPSKADDKYVTTVGGVMNGYHADCSMSRGDVAGNYANKAIMGEFVSTTVKTIRWSKYLHTICNEAFNACAFNGLKVEFPSSLRRIGTKSFYKCGKLSGVVFNDGLEMIASCAFELATISGYIYIPASVKQIGQGAFWNIDSNLMSPFLGFRCAASSKPEGWSDDWNEHGWGEHYPVQWGCSR